MNKKLPAWLLLLCMTFGLINALPTRAQVASETLTINLNSPIGPAQHRASGFLASISETNPLNTIITQIKPKLFRLNRSTGKTLYSRVVSLGATPQMVPSYPDFNGPPSGMDYETWWATWAQHLNETVDETISRNETWQWDIWNEPNWFTYWIGTRQQYLETWKRSYAIIKSKLPNATIVGPSAAFYDYFFLREFLLYSKTNNVLPDILSWHELSDQSPGQITNRVQDIKSFMAQNSIPITRIQLNEISATTYQFYPGYMTHFFAEIERAKIEAAGRSCWWEGFIHNCFNNSLNGLLTSDQQTRSVYWVYKSYADITGELTSVIPSTKFDGVAGYTSGNIRILTGNHSSSASAVNLNINSINQVSGFGTANSIRVRTTRINNSTQAVIAQPSMESDTVYPISNGSAQISFSNIEGWGAIFLEITPSNTTTPPPPTPVPPPSPSSSTKLINLNGTYYLIINSEKMGITNPGILFSHGYEFKDGIAPTSTEVALPVGGNLLPADGALVKTALDPTVYLITEGKKLGFVSEAVFTGLGYKFSSVLTVTAPELNMMPLGPIIESANIRHFRGTNVIHEGTIYWIGSTTRQPYPSMEVYNSWNIDNDFSRVVPANIHDLNLPLGSIVQTRP